MTLEQIGKGRLRLVDHPGSLIHWVGGALALIAVAVVLFARSPVAGAVTAIAVAGLWLALRYSDIATEAIFDKRKGRFHVRHKSLGKPQHEYEGALEEIEGVVLEASGATRHRDEKLALRPALVVGGRPLPLTFGRYARGDKARDIALALRSFLGLPRRGLLEDSIRLAARDPLRSTPAIRLAQLGKGLPADEAAAYVERLKAEHGEWEQG